jgi:hypothetical protein
MATNNLNEEDHIDKSEDDEIDDQSTVKTKKKRKKKKKNKGRTRHFERITNYFIDYSRSNNYK